MRIFAILILFLTVACTPSMQSSEGPPGIRFGVDPEVAAAGDSIALSLENESPEPISYNLCSSALHRRAGDEWAAIAEDRFCTLELRILEPGEADEFRLQLPPALDPGEYAYTTTIHLEELGSAEQVWSEPFTVR